MASWQKHHLHAFSLHPFPFSLLCFPVSVEAGQTDTPELWMCHHGSCVRLLTRINSQSSTVTSVCIHHSTGSFFASGWHWENAWGWTGPKHPQFKIRAKSRRTCSSRLDADWLEAAVESRGIDDVRVKVAMVLAVNNEGHDDRDDQAHDYGDDDAYVESHVVCAWGSCGFKKKKTERKWTEDKDKF